MKSGRLSNLTEAVAICWLLCQSVERVRVFCRRIIKKEAALGTSFSCVYCILSGGVREGDMPTEVRECWRCLERPRAAPPHDWEDVSWFDDFWKTRRWLLDSV